MRRLIVTAATTLVLATGFTAFTTTTAMANRSAGVTGAADCTTATWTVRGDDTHDGVITDSARGLFNGVPIGGGAQVTATEPIGPGQTLDMWVAMRFPPPTPRPKGWVESRPPTTPVHVTGLTDCEPPPPVDVCKDIPGDQPEGTDCTPVKPPVVKPPSKPHHPEKSKCGTRQHPQKPCPRDTHTTHGPNKHQTKPNGIGTAVHQTPPRECKPGQTCLPPTGVTWGVVLGGCLALILVAIGATLMHKNRGRR